MNILYIPNVGEIVVFISAFLGALIGFLWFNAYPAEIFMGDTGSLTIGALISVISVIIRKELLIPLLCGIFFIETLSVIFQVSYFKYSKFKTGNGKRIFKMAPLHHHYQKLGFHESKIVARFLILGIVLAVLTIVTLKTQMMDKKIAVLGAGESGVGAAILGKKKGYEVFLSEKENINKKLKKLLSKEGIKWECGQHSIENLISADYVVKSPGIPLDTPIIKLLRKKRKNIISEIEFAALHTSAILIGITGTNGKTTTTLLTYHILRGAGFNVGIAGNIGKSFSLQVAKMNYDIYVLEISSFQLDDINKFSPHIAVITNVTPDHLDRYNFKLKNYISAKLKIIKNQSKKDFFLFNSEDPLLMAALKNVKIKSKKFQCLKHQ